MNLILSGMRIGRLIQATKAGCRQNFSTASAKNQWLKSSLHRKLILWTLAVGAIPTGYFTWKTICSSATVHALKGKRKDEIRSIKLTSRERRFLRFASVEYDGQLYMTPQDFLESVVEAEPRPRLKRKTLSKQDLESIRENTPLLSKGSPQMFRNLRDKGIISYTEYLFLLSILTKPQTGFRIAFNMFDTDGNEKVDKNEFLVLLYLIPLHTYKQEFSIQKMQAFVRISVPQKNCESSSASVTTTPFPTSDTPSSPPKLEEIFSMAWKEKRGIVSHEAEGTTETSNKETEKNAIPASSRMEEILNEVLVDDDRGLQRRHFVDTTLLVHFFGPKGKRDIRYEDFKKYVVEWKYHSHLPQLKFVFMEDLQTEVQELEFHEFSKGLDCISQMDFAKILLRYTYLESEEYDLYLERLMDRIKLEQGITFLEFRAFCQFLNNLDDFSVAMRMYTLADRPISQEEFRRAVRICTGTDLSPHVIETVFQIFDADNDSHLSHREFIGVMKDRLHRGFKNSGKAEGLEAFKNCLKQELRTT